MRKLTHRLMNRNGFYKSHLFQYLWLIALLIFVQQLGKGQDSLYLQSPCLCKNDQSANGAKDGSFTDTVIVKGVTAASDCYTVVELTKAPMAMGIDPIPMWNSGFGKFTPLGDSLYALTIMHFDSTGYRVIVEGPKAAGDPGNTKDTIGNVCIYPVIQWNPSIAYTYDIDDPTVVNLGTEEIHGEKGDSTITLNGAAASSFTPKDLGIGMHTLKATFDGTFKIDTGNLADPGYPGCNTGTTKIFVVSSDNVSTSLCNCTGATGINTMSFVDTIKIVKTGADSFSIDSISFFNPNTKTITAGAFFKVNDINGQEWIVGDTLVKAPGIPDTFCFVGYFTGDVDATITFISHKIGANPDTVKVNIPACGDPNNLQIIGPDSICQGNMAIFTLNEMADSIAWTFGNKCSDSDWGVSCSNGCGGEILGCRDVNAHNYNPHATQDDGSCQTCSDNVQNGAEVGLDCGGSCAACSNVCTDPNSSFRSPLSLSITFDRWPQETSWAIKTSTGTIVDSANYLSSRDKANTTIRVSNLVIGPADDYIFNFYDDVGDGICCGYGGDGVFILTDADRRTVKTDGDFRFLSSQIFCIGGDPCSNGVLDEGETGVDCGGECEACISGCTVVNTSKFMIPSVDTSGWVTVTAFGSIKGNCIPFNITKQVYVQDTSFEIEGSLFACLNDTIDYSLNLKGATPNYNTITGLKWAVMGGGKIIGDSVNVLNIKVMWDTIAKLHMVLVNGVTTDRCVISDTITVQVDSILQAQIAGPDTVCLGDVHGYRALVAKIDTLLWTTLPTAAGKVAEISEDSVNIQWLKVGTHQIIVNGKADGFACDVVDSTFMVTVMDTSFLITGFDASCQGDSTGFGLRNLDGTPVKLKNLTWKVVRNSNNQSIPPKDTLMIAGNVSPGVRDSINVKWDSIGFHTVIATGETVDGCTVSETKTVSVRDSIFTIFGDTTVCLMTTTLYMVYDANNMPVTNMQIINWVLKKEGGGTFLMPSDDSLFINWLNLPGNYTLTVNGMTDDGCPVNDSIMIKVLNPALLKINSPSLLCGFRDTIWTLGVSDSFLNMVTWDIIGETGTFTTDASAIDTFKATAYTFAPGSVHDSVRVVVSGKVGSQCTFTDTLAVVVRDTTCQIFGDAIVCNSSDTSLYYVDVPGIDSISWSVSGAGNNIVDSLGAKGDSIKIKWSTNGTITTFIRTADGCDITDSLFVFVRESSVILGDTAVSEFDTVTYTLKGVTATDTLDFTDLTFIDWSFPVNADSIGSNSLGDTVTVVFSTNLSGEPFYLDTICVVFMTNDGCMDTIIQPLQIRETTYGLKGMEQACLSDTFMWNIGFFNELNVLTDLPPNVVADIDTFIWSLPGGGGVVVSSDGNSAFLSFTSIGTFPVKIEGVFNDSRRFTVLDSITVRSNQLALIGDVDGILCEGQALQGFAIEELNGGNATILGTDQFNGIIWAAGTDGTIDNGTGTTPFASNPDLATEAANATASFLDSLENAQLKAFTRNFLQNSALISGLTNGSSKGMVAGINATFTNALTADILFVAAVTTAGCTFANVLDIAVHNRIDGASIACNNLVNISLGADCDLIISPDMVLEDPQFDLREYSVRIEELNGTFISNGRVGPNEIGKQVRVVITHDCSGNSCWGLLLIEDKNIPDLICSADTIECDDSIDPNATHWTWNLPGRYRGFPIPANAMAFPVNGQPNTYTVTNFELCGNAVLTYSDNEDVLSCADGMGKKILRTWTLVNGSNLTVSCIDTINVEKLDIDSIDFRQFIPHQAYDCSQKPSILKEIGYPDEAITGNLDALNDDQCFQLNAGFTDTSIPLCGNSWKFFRHWTIIDWCTAEDRTILQIIAFKDTTAPVVNRPVVFDNISDDHECTNTFSIRKPDYTDCSEIILVRLELRIVGDPNWTLWAEKDNPNEDFTNISFGTDGDQVEARYILTDACSNVGTSSAFNPIDSTSSAFNPIDIKDDITPVAVCDDEVVITLNDDGVAFATIYSFDDGSVDNCGIVKREIRRLSTDCPNDNGESPTFGSLVMFCCADVDKDDVKVVLRVTDAAGNSNICVTIVTVQDNLTKLNVFNIPPDVTVSCGTDLSDLDTLYGDPIFRSSACGVKANPEEVVLGFPLDASCGKGIITRTWTATGSSGQKVSAQQVITVGKNDEVLTLDKITFPDDINITGCIGDLNPKTNPDLGVPIYSNVPCSDPISTYTDLIFKHTDGFCAKVIRTWSVVDWCTVESLDRNNPDTLFFKGIQVIKLTDNVAPTINSGCDDEIVSTNNSSCTGFFSFSATGSDNCPTGVLKWAYEVDFDKDGTVDLTGKSSSFDASLSVGAHSIKWILSDGCENKDSCTKMVTVMDENPPVLTCPAEHTIVFNDQGQGGSITVIGLLAGGADDDCSNFQLSFSFSANDDVESLLFNCNDLAAQSSMIQNVYVTDGLGNVASCKVSLRLSDPGNVCGLNTSSVVLSGTVFTENNYTVDNVDMRLTDLSDRVLDQQMTPVSGEYAFTDVLTDENYTLKPIKNDNYLNGVSTIDLVLIQNHILGLRSFDSPYKVIASDVDGSNTVSVIDLIHIRKLILGITDDLPIGRSWSFVDANHEFDDVLNPFPYTDIITMMNVGTDYDDIDFVAVKMADVNDNVSIASAQLSENRSISHLTIENRLIKENTMFSIPFEANVDLNMAGLQMGIAFDADAVEFMGVYGNGFNITKEHINEEYLEFGEIVFSWNGVQNIEIAKGDAVFELRFVSKQEMRLGEVVHLNDVYLISEIYTDNGSGVIEVSEMYLDTREPEHLSDELVLYQNRPNPFDASTEIRFSLPKESVIELDIFDMAGRAVHHHEARYQRGMNKIAIDEKTLGDGGIYIYQIADGESVVQMKMIYIK